MTQTTTEGNWLIEKMIDGRPHWWVRRDGQDEHWNLPHRWTTDPYKARRYYSKESAEYVIGKDMVGCYATEHSWDMEIIR